MTTTDLRAAAQAVVARWDTPLWKDAPHTAEFIERLRTALAEHEAAPTAPDAHPSAAPIDMVLHCPACGMQHIDAPEPGRLVSGGPNAGRAFAGWINPPHRSHMCLGCGHTWRPADVPTNGVAAVKTKGKRDDEPLGRNCLADRFKERADLLNEVRENFTRDDDLPNGLLSRIDDAIGEQT